MLVVLGLQILDYAPKTYSSSDVSGSFRENLFGMECIGIQP